MVGDGIGRAPMKAPGFLLTLILTEQVWSVWPERLAGDDSLRQAETKRRQEDWAKMEIPRQKHARYVTSLRRSTRSQDL
ncbi:hypothetical protein F5X68DRAFT_208435 [Plectosphaerella plurivora]|uniref:Uncharacterized protein n=1 Tax=Plectosphaerella plurivora TaxID=936078 RepID=A0A9P8VB46_9PEZI|nr:hypothetical protein F5X68DRAFT_208435 [Plectosphaerella plurivora]